MISWQLQQMKAADVEQEVNYIFSAQGTNVFAPQKGV